jgi:hypothetical protein
MPKTTPDTILLKGKQFTIHEEANAGAAIMPGHLVDRNSSGEYVVHAVAAGNAAPSFALENELFGNGIEVAYAQNDQCIVAHCPRGAWVYALVAAAASAIVIGDYLESAGDGTLRKLTAAAATSQASRASVVARAVQAVDNSGGGTAARIKVEVL